MSPVLGAELPADIPGIVQSDPGWINTFATKRTDRPSGQVSIAGSRGGDCFLRPDAWFLPEPEERLSLPLPGRPQGPGQSVVQRPLVFERNDGQTAAAVAFVSRGRGYSLFLTRDEAVIELLAPQGRNADLPVGTSLQLENRRYNAEADTLQVRMNAAAPAPQILRMRLAGSNPRASVSGVKPLAAKANYFIGNDPSRWRTNIPTFGEVRFEEVYSGIDLVYYGNEGRLEYDFVVAPSADPNQIALEFDGAESLKVHEDGDLVLSVGGRELRWQKPLIYQEANGKRMEIAGRYRIRDPLNRSADRDAAANSTMITPDLQSVQFVTFELAAHDPALPLVIDPILVYSTYLGGSGDDGGHGVAVDGRGNVYVAGPTAATDFPTTNALYSQSAGGQNDVFVAKFNPAGELLFSTYLGGTGDDGALFDPVRIALSPSGECFIVGATASSDFPLVNAIQEWFAGGAGDAFVTALTADGSALTFSTYLGGGLGEGARNIAFGPGGDIYVVGSTFSADFPVVNAFQPQMALTDGTDRDAFILRIGAGDKRIVYSTFYGRSATRELAMDVTVDADGSAYPVFWVAHSIYSQYQWMIAKFNPNGSSRLFERRWPTVMTDYKTVSSRPFIALAPDDTFVLAGAAFGLPLPAANQPHPLTNPTLSMGTSAGFSDVYVAVFSATNGAYLTARYFGGGGSESPDALWVNGAGEILIAGTTSGAYWEPSGFPVTDPLESGPNPGTSEDVFVAKFRPSDLSLAFSTVFGGPGDEAAVDMALDARGNPWIVGRTVLWRTPAQLPTLNAFQAQSGGGTDAFLVSLSLRDVRVQITRSGQNVTLSWPVEATDYILEAATSLPPVTWDVVTNTPTLTTNERSVQLPVTGTARFFRLRQP